MCRCTYRRERVMCKVDVLLQLRILFIALRVGDRIPYRLFWVGDAGESR